MTRNMIPDRYPLPAFLRRPVVALRERPILFSAPMVRALLDGTKTQTRRVVKPQPDWSGLTREEQTWPNNWKWFDSSGLDRCCPYGQPGHRLYVRESAWQRPERTAKMMLEGADTWPPFIYDADYPAGLDEDERDFLQRNQWKRRPSIHLPRFGSRILLEITDIRVERLNEISEADAIAEGVEHGARGGWMERRAGEADREWADSRMAYRALWESINGTGSWDENPWVWRVAFTRLLGSA